jgi:energy-coupling factor transporter ATP-binding protein EcfA2
MKTVNEPEIELNEQGQLQAVARFSQALGVPDVPAETETVGDRVFLKFRVGRSAPIYDKALRDTNKSLPASHPFRGLLGLHIEPSTSFPGSLEAEVLRGILARSTRVIAGNEGTTDIATQYVPFQNNEEALVIQPATHLIVGRRGVGKSTLIVTAKELLRRNGKLVVVLDMQSYKTTVGESLIVDVLSDLSRAIADAAQSAGKTLMKESKAITDFADKLLSSTSAIQIDRASTSLRRLVHDLTKAAQTDLFVFLDDFHLVQLDHQARLVEAVHGALKGARGWLKVAGLQSLLKPYDPSARMGLQTPGDAQLISLDLTLVDPEAAEEHLKRILLKFLELVGITNTRQAIADAAFQRLVWANAGVPRDFLQMFASAIDHSARANRSKVELTDANLAIGELGQQKVNDMENDARNEESSLRDALAAIEKHCLDKNKINAFLIRSESSEEYRSIQTLADLRLLHILHKTITPHKAGERYEAYMLDYSLFTGFRRRPNIKQMMPSDGKQFRAAELRKIPILPKGFLAA